jgi:hypothetical protein
MKGHMKLRPRLIAGAIAVLALGTGSACVLAAVKEKLSPPPPQPPPEAPTALAKKVKLELLTRDTTEALALVSAPGEAVGRMFLVEKRGYIKILRGKTVDSKPFLDVSDRVSLERRDNGEQGLLGLAFHPHFQKNGRFYINFTDTKGDTRVLEMGVDKKDRSRADPTTARELLFVDQPFANHNAGDLAFGPDGKLYVLLGDGGSANDPRGYAQNPKSLLGKMLRFDVETTQPAPEILGRGLRNPWRISFDRKTGDLYIADVGQNLWEWVHVLPAKRLTGHNLGWNITEGRRCFRTSDCDTRGIRLPVIDYPHSEGCSITGGFVYRGKAIPEIEGLYFFADYCTALLRSFRWKNGRAVDHWDWKPALDPDAQLARLASFGQDQDGELYLVSHEGPIYKLVRR